MKPEEYLDTTAKAMIKSAYRADKTKFSWRSFCLWADLIDLEGKRNPSAYLQRCFKNELDKGTFAPRKEEEIPEEEKPKTIAEEIAAEAKDMEEMAKMCGLIAQGGQPRPPTEPNAPRLFQKPSILETFPESLRGIYAANTYIAVKREADAQHTSMHEICRRKNLNYGHLIY